ncbi:MAG: S8 family serine peptidase [Candidatus Poseidoniaceae archaeon]|nr:S8 family serine peptidase [Candidatus Poseidoniaceae archaeon]
MLVLSSLYITALFDEKYYSNLHVEKSFLEAPVNFQSTIDPECGLATYSPAVQIAFSRQNKLLNGAENQQFSKDWLVVMPSQDCSINWQDMVLKVQEMGAIGLQSTILEHTWVITFADGNIAQEQLTTTPEVQAFHPMLEFTHDKRLIPNDTKFGDQWHLRNTGQGGGTSGEDVNITGAWNNYDGSGVLIAIVDDGVDTTHDDLSPNYQNSLDYDYCSNDGNPNPSTWDGHGTSAAGVAAAYGNDNYGVTGAAMDADLIGIRLIACSLTDTKESNALLHQKGSVDIYSNSWGPTDNGQTVEAPGPLMTAAFEEQAYNGRLGAGGIITFAGGNGGNSEDDSNYDGYANSRYTIAVGAIDDDGDQSYYSESGANLLIVAPSNGGSSGITTTDIEGSGGYSNGDWNDDFGGTSSATPLVSGIIAQMFEANSALTWRDVQHILVQSSRTNDANDNGWFNNGAGHDFNHKYGHGVIDSGHATSLSANWINVQPEVNFTTGQLNVNQAIPDNTNSWTTFTHTVNQGMKVESVEVLFDASHSYRGDLEVVLVSPDGTESVMAVKHSDSGNNWNDWVFTSTAHWDEMSDGDWTLKVRDQGNGDTGTLNYWSLSLHGTNAIVDSDNDGLWDSNETEIHNTDPFDADTDDDGLNDGEEVLDWGTDPNAVDSDLDGLEDGEEVNVHGTNPLDDDSDDDGLSDGDEVNIYGTDPTVYDADADLDTFYWFADCNDSDPLIYPGAVELLDGKDQNCNNMTDEGFDIIDSDSDNLSDFSEYHNHSTDIMDNDTDDDGLLDGDEVNIFGTNPLVADADNDSDSYYWFADCNDSDASIHPNAQELLNGIDEDCDDEIDEDFITLDSDNDTLTDLNEFKIFGTNWSNPDTDGDGLDDGSEVWYYLTDPLVADADADGDNWYHFQDCDDNNSSINPDMTEIWNGVDDDCDDLIDEGTNPPLQRPSFVSVLAPSVKTAGEKTDFNATAVNADGGIFWTIAGHNYSSSSVENIVFTDAGTIDWQVCAYNGNLSKCATGQMTVRANQSLESNTTDEDGMSDDQTQTGSGASAASDEQSLTTSQLMAIALLFVLAGLLLALIRRRDGGGGAQTWQQQPQQYASRQAGYGNIPAAPTLPPPDGSWQNPPRSW